MKDYGIKVSHIVEGCRGRFTEEEIKTYIDTRHNIYKRYYGILRRSKTALKEFDIPTAYDFFIEKNATHQEYEDTIELMRNTTIFDIRKWYCEGVKG